MKTNSFAAGGVCSTNRLKATAKHFEEIRGATALETFLRNAAGVSSVDNVAEDDRFRVNAAMREEINKATPLQSALGRIRTTAFAKRVRR